MEPATPQRMSYTPLDAASLRDDAGAATRHGRRIAIVAAAAIATAAVATAGFGGSKNSVGEQQQLRRFPADGVQVLRGEEEDEPTWVQGKDFDSKTPAMDVDFDYHFEGWGTNYDHIPDPEFCAAMCQGVPKCKAYTWVKDAKLDGCPSQCWLKGGTGVKVAKKGVVSGVPPPRKPVQRAPQLATSKAGTMYCFSLMVPHGYEEGILKWQHEKRAGIFGCDAAAIYSNEPIHVADGVVAKVVNSTLKCGYGGDSNSALNSWIFISVWDKVIDLGEYKMYDWVVKVDPDCVFFPHRLARLLVPYAGAGGYINNCKYGMHGPIEVFSKDAIDVLALDFDASWDGKAPKTCVNELKFDQWGEDMFIDQCLSKTLDVRPRALEPKVMCESHCDCPSWYWCQEGKDTVSYHPFKSIDAYANCMANALDAELAASELEQ